MKQSLQLANCCKHCTFSSVYLNNILCCLHNTQTVLKGESIEKFLDWVKEHEVNQVNVCENFKEK